MNRYVHSILVMSRHIHCCLDTNECTIRSILKLLPPQNSTKGWGKKLSYVIGATHDSVTDITKRYTRKFHTDDFQTRRREYSPDEPTSDSAFYQMNSTIMQMSNVAKSRLEELERRGRVEDKFFGLVQSSGVWDNDYKEGRISGSYAWKSVRGELGNQKKSDDNESKEETNEEASFVVESFYPAPHRSGVLSIFVQHPSMSSHECIIVNGVPCAAILASGTSIVVVDELSGCILQCRAFSCWSSVGAFVDTVPDGRIIAIASNISSVDVDQTTAKYLQRVGGLVNDTKPSPDPLMFIGQIGYYPKWSTCVNTTDVTKSVNVTIQLDNSSSLATKLRSERNTTPAVVLTRLPETVMPLKTQMGASEYQKRVAFEAFMKQDNDAKSAVVGYVRAAVVYSTSSSCELTSILISRLTQTTRPETPVYLIGNKSFPIRSAGGSAADTGSNNANWTTYHYLPEALVADDDVITNGIGKASSKSSNPAMFDIPVADDYFMGLLGGEILTKTGTSSPSVTNTVDAIENTRLVALYFR